MNKEKITIKIDKDLFKMVKLIQRKRHLSTIVEESLKFYLTNYIQLIPAIEKYNEWYIPDWWDD